MNLIIAVALVAGSLGMAVFFGWMGARPKDYANPSVVNWQVLMLISAALVLVVVVHLVNVLGVTTGGNVGK
jgi:amino acid transporter